MSEKYIFWDWNGTLLDDALYSFNNINKVLAYREKPLLPSLEYYRSIFCFPVSEYYVRAGIEPERFVPDGQRWMDLYVADERECPLRQDVLSVMDALKKDGFHQVILSASKLDFLTMQAEERGVTANLDGILGLSHIWATSKIEIGCEYMQSHAIAPASVCMIGDTLHDAEVAKALGTHCVLVLGGHQDLATLSTAGVPVENDLPSAVQKARELIG